MVNLSQDGRLSVSRSTELMFFLSRWGDGPVGVIEVPVVDLVSVPLPGPELHPRGRSCRVSFWPWFLHRNPCPSKGPLHWTRDPSGLGEAVASLAPGIHASSDPLAVNTQKHPYSTPMALVFGQEVPQLRTAAGGLAGEALAIWSDQCLFPLNTSLLVFAALLRY